MTAETKARIGFGLGGLLLEGLILYGILGPFSRAEDEDRPPIIVWGGSITFQSGSGPYTLALYGVTACRAP